MIAVYNVKLFIYHEDLKNAFDFLMRGWLRRLCVCVCVCVCVFVCVCGGGVAGRSEHYTLIYDPPLTSTWQS